MFGKYASFIVPAYSLSMFVLALVVVRIRITHRKRLAALHELEREGAGRRSGKPGIGQEQMSRAMPKKRFWLSMLPLAIFVVLVGVFLTLLLSERDRTRIPSVLIGKPAPNLELPKVEGLVFDSKPVPGIPLDVFAGKVSLVNFWASWCEPCKLEHPLIMGIARNKQVQMIGINYKDRAKKAAGFLLERGNPYDLVGADIDGRAAIEWGVYGMPETFLVDKSGTIVFKHTGRVTPDIYKDELLPRIADML